jgi:hypothetical protein
MSTIIKCLDCLIITNEEVEQDEEHGINITAAKPTISISNQA